MGADFTRVLLVEDDLADVAVVRDALDESGCFEVFAVGTFAAAAAHLAERSQPHVVLLDLTLPDSSGIHNVRALRQLADIPIVVITAAEDEELALHALQSGAEDYLAKGAFSPDVLARALRYAIERARAKARVTHLSDVLRAVRKVNKLLIEVRDVDELARRACAALVETRRYLGARLIHTDAAGAIVASAEHAQRAGVFGHLATPRSLAELPLCCRLACDRGGEVISICDHAQCAGCADAAEHEQLAALAVGLVHDGRTLGALAAYLPPEAAISDDERRIFGELADDLAVALHKIESDKLRAAAEEALGASEQRYRAIFETAANLIVCVDRRDVIVECNGRARAVLAAAPERVVGRELPSVAHDDDRSKLREALRRARQGRAVSGLSCRLLRSDGEVAHVLINLAAEKNSAAAPSVVCVIEDMTERLQMQASLAHADRMATIGLLAAGVAHEINNPLTFVLFNLESLAAALPKLLEVAAGDYTGNLSDILEQAQDALEGARRVQHVVRDLKTFARVDEGRSVSTSLNQVIEGALNMAQNEIKYRARVVKSLGDLPLVRANDGRIAQVFLNLLVNAAHAIGEGDIDNSEISVRTWVDGDHVAAEVRDTGTGIEADKLERIFEPFYTTKDIGVGSGLGLSICRSIVHGAGGTIEVHSEVGVGSRFVVRLPIGRRAEPPRRKRRPTALDAVLAGRRVLVVDDELAVGKALRRVLSGADDVQVVSSAREAQTLLEARRFDAIFCDLMMPTATGMDLYERLAEHDPEHARRVIFMTGGAFTPNARAFLETVGNARVEKPFERASLLAALEALFRAGEAG